ncbi:GNVR domain-containing protein [Burkholderia sp. SCN-KJ]|uniref:GNVR domain-containing protein n=1 Tax=Burkholderia sp. SCN-KJ TaxID=2969248 RepID=UPI0021504697|nr:GNVR domain-containing protein [Burkholderia sp. SCN-KJ]MCR4467005.1 Wzz/FepE/Etk N-terminal domain-containing protein [Burkholderia sp. SCN-KJ]
MNVNNNARKVTNSVGSSILEFGMKMERPSSSVHRNREQEATSGALGLSPVDMLENVFENWRIFLAVFAVCLLTALAYALAAAPVYSADTLIQVEENKASALGSLSAISKALDIQNSAVTGEIDIVRSRSVVTEAIDATAAQVNVSVEHRFPLIGGLIGSLMSKDANGLVAAPFGLSSWAWGGERLEFNAFDVPYAQIGKALEFDYLDGNRFRLKDGSGRQVLSGVVGELSSANGYRVDVSRIVARPGAQFRVRSIAKDACLDAVLKKLSVTETKRQSGIMLLNFEDADPVFAARMLNAIAESYLNFNARRRAGDAERSLSFLNTQLPIVKARLQQAEQALNAFRNQQGSIDAQGDIKLLVDQLAFVDKSRLEAKLEYHDLLSKYVPGQPQVVAVANKIKELDQQATVLKDKAARLPSQQQTYLRLARDVEVNNQLYVGLLNNTQQLQIAEAGTVGNASIVDKAVVSDKSVRPKRVLVVLMGAVIGLMLGFSVTQGLAFLSGRIRNPDRLESAIGIPILGVLPNSPLALQSDTKKKFALVTKDQADVPLADALESLTLALQYKLRADRRESKLVLVSSAVPGQGKSMIAANLAYLFSQKGLKTLIVDANMQTPALCRYLPVTATKGLVDVLKNSLQPESAITCVTDNLHALFAGKNGASVNRFSAADLDRAIASLRGNYDMVIVDAPTALPVAAVATWSRFADMTLLVARQGLVSIAGMAEAVDGLGKVGARVDGLVFNGFEPSSLSCVVRRASMHLRQRDA